MQFLRLYVILAIALTPAFAAAATDADNRGMILVLVAMLVGYAGAVLFGATLVNRMRRSAAQA